MADNIGALGPGSPVFYRDITVGEVLGYDQPGLHGKIVVHVFVRAPYDKYVRDDSRFWNTSGVEVAIGAGGIRVQMESIQAVLSGGIAFATPPESRAEPPARPETQFELFKDATSASVATSKDRIELLSYFQGSVRGLGIGSTVEIDGIRVGSVTDMRLEYDAAGHDFRVRVRMAIEPDLLTFAQAPPSAGGVRQVLNDFVQRGMQAELQTSSYLTGTMVVALAVPQDARPGVIRLEDGAILMPGMVGGIGNIATSLSDITAKLDKIPFDHIGQSLNDTLGHVNQLVRKTDTGLSPVLQQLPTLEADLHQTLRRVSDMLGEKGYGEDSAFKHDMSRLMDQANDTLRSIRAVADFLERHPEALIRGRGGEGNSR
jgi:paraquat-inducible protein B